MRFVATQIRRLWDAAFAVVFVLVFLQLPHFLELYRHRLDEKRVQIERILTELNASPTKDTTTIAAKEAELPPIRANLEAVSRGGFARVTVFWNLDWDVARRTYDSMKPGLTFDGEALQFGVAGLLCGLVTSGLSAALFGALLPRRRERGMV
ncbi:MAG: DUF2937 family protein [Tagaea sp.]|nr:DUF2937 family protein [Tagaea sp.]